MGGEGRERRRGHRGRQGVSRGMADCCEPPCEDRVFRMTSDSSWPTAADVISVSLESLHHLTTFIFSLFPVGDRRNLFYPGCPKPSY